MAKVAINGFGRIGRALFKLALEKPELEIVAINDLGDLDNLVYLLKYDSVYGQFKPKVESLKTGDTQYIVVDDKKFRFIQEKDPAHLPWEALRIDIVVEATGMFESYEKASVHLRAGAKRVVLTAPAKDEDRPEAKTVLMGVNEDDLKTCSISSNGSCTTNSASPVMDILSEKLGIKKAFLNTVHAYTAVQSLVDGTSRNKDFRHNRAGAINIIPSPTGAATAVTRAVHELLGRFDGVAMRVPVATGSLSAIVFLSSKTTTSEEINSILELAAGESRWQGIFTTTRDPIVSTDIIGNPHAAIADLSLTHVTDEDLCAVYSWYDNEFGYTNSLIRHILKVSENLK